MGTALVLPRASSYYPRTVISFSVPQFSAIAPFVFHDCTIVIHTFRGVLHRDDDLRARPDQVHRACVSTGGPVDAIACNAAVTQ